MFFIYILLIYIMKNNYVKLSIITVVITIIFIILLNFVIPYYKNEVILKSHGTLLKDDYIYYNVKKAVGEYLYLLVNEDSYNKLKEIILNTDDFSKDTFNNIISTYKYDFLADVDKIYKLSDNTYRCEYTLEQDYEQGNELVNLDEVKDEKIYNNVVVIKFNKDFSKYKVIYNKIELKGGSVYEK